MKEKIRKGYKVVTERRDWDNKKERYVTIGYGPTSQQNPKLMYKPRKWIERLPGYGPYCLFSNIKDAQAFGGKYRTIFECEYIKSNEKFAWSPYNDIHIKEMPKGKVLAEKFKMLRKAK